MRGGSFFSKVDPIGGIWFDGGGGGGGLKKFIWLGESAERCTPSPLIRENPDQSTAKLEVLNV